LQCLIQRRTSLLLCLIQRPASLSKFASLLQRHASLSFTDMTHSYYFPFNDYHHFPIQQLSLTQWLASLLQQFVHINKLPRSDYFSFKRDNLSILDLPLSYNGLYISTTGLARLFKRRATLSIQRLASQHASLWCRIQNEIKGSGSEFFASSCANRFNPTQHEVHAQDERRKRRGGGGWRKKK